MTKTAASKRLKKADRKLVDDLKDNVGSLRLLWNALRNRDNAMVSLWGDASEVQQTSVLSEVLGRPVTPCDLATARKLLGVPELPKCKEFDQCVT